MSDKIGYMSKALQDSGIRDAPVEEHEWHSNTDLLTKKSINKPLELQAWRFYKWRYMIIIWIVVSMYITFKFDQYFIGHGGESIYTWIITFPICLLITLVPVFAVYTYSRAIMLNWDVSGAKDVSEYIDFHDNDIKNLFGKGLSKKVAMETLHEAYFDEKIDFKGDLLHTLENHHKYAHFRFTYNHLKFVFTNLIPELIIHSRSQDRAQVQDHYNRGNDFFRCFLGPLMVYTCAVFNSPDESLELAQRRKLDLVCKKLHMKKGQTHLDLGCGWGTLVAHASSFYGTQSTGITLAKEQVAWGVEQASNKMFNISSKDVSMNTKGSTSRANFFVCDYRDKDVYASNNKKFNCISCLEMSEHVGVKLFQSFLCQVYDMLEEDGLFYLQIAGLRRSWTFADLVWGLFMDKYIFPGADASAPLFIVCSELEKAGFEVHSVENVGVHYSMTIFRWYKNWNTNKEYILKTYGERWYRIWNFFLAWSTIISRIGRSTAYQIVCQKNTSEFDRSVYVGEQRKYDFFADPQ